MRVWRDRAISTGMLFVAGLGTSAMLALIPMPAEASQNEAFQKLKPLRPTVSAAGRKTKGLVRGHCVNATEAGAEETGVFAQCASGDAPVHPPKPRLRLTRQANLVAKLPDNPLTHDDPARGTVRPVRFRPGNRPLKTFKPRLKLRVGVGSRSVRAQVSRRIPKRANGLVFEVEYEPPDPANPEDQLIAGDILFYVGIRPG